MCIRDRVIIEKKAENLYRTISQKMKSLPNSNLAVRQSVPVSYTHLDVYKRQDETRAVREKIDMILMDVVKEWDGYEI